MAALNPTDLAAAISTALPQAWQDVKGTPFTANPQDVQPLLLAISRGLLSYLNANESTLIASITLTATGGTPVNFTAANLDLRITGF